MTAAVSTILKYADLQMAAEALHGIKEGQARLVVEHA